MSSQRVPQNHGLTAEGGSGDGLELVHFGLVSEEPCVYW